LIFLCFDIDHSSWFGLKEPVGFRSLNCVE